MKNGIGSCKSISENITTYPACFFFITLSELQYGQIVISDFFTIIIQFQFLKVCLNCYFIFSNMLVSSPKIQGMIKGQQEQV
jgi:hypothetical protein